MFRLALFRAAAALGWNAGGVREKEAKLEAARMLRVPPEAVERKLMLLGKDLGSPWRDDQKLATLGAWLALEKDGL